MSSTSSASSMIRLSGMASNLDTDSIIKNLMKIEQMKVDKVVRQKIKLEWNQTAHKAVNTQLTDFRSKYMSVLSSSNLYSSTAFKALRIDQNSTDAVTVTAGAGADTGSHTINSITQLAAAATTSSENIASSAISKYSTLETLSASLNVPLTFGGDQSDTVSFKINDVAFSFNKTDTLDQVINKVNFSEAKVWMSYSSLSNGLKIESRTTGASSSVKIENTLGNAFGADTASSAFGIAAGTTANGKNAILKIDGYAVEKSENSFIIDGLTYKLKQKTDVPVTFSVEQDVDTVVSKVKQFVTDYNTLVESLNSTLSEKVDSDYYPLTDTEKEEMSEDEITLWENKAKAGIMRNDSQLTGLMDDMRSMIYDKVEGIGKSLSDIGLTTGSWYEKGKLVLDETKFKDALSNNPDEVSALFTQSASAGSTNVYGERGFLPRLVQGITDYNKTYDSDEVDQKIGNLEDKIDEMNDKLETKEEQLWSKFSAMETALSKMNSQSSWLSQQFS
ncbi:MAG: flagellar filament capping protein FliD [Clostridiaceae bacterium]|nr:flagellar filament capping protein FliD [Clostridiaceae bacterium]